ncbi:MAG: MATE family efflux transporter [Endomicrobia bacterium]|nr:MATE family efflux transporter [Endomicrobiia bacterium]
MRGVRRHTEGNITKSIFSLAIPVIIANFFTIALELTDAIFVGKLGSDVLAGVSMAGTVMFFLSTFVGGLSIGLISLLSRAFGEKNYKKADHIALQALYLGIIISSIIGIIGFLTSDLLLKFLGANSYVLEVGSSYAKILFVGLFTMFFMFLGNAVFQSAGDTLTPMKINAFSVVVNIILDPIMIFGLFGFPRWEAKGAAVATVLSRSFGSLIMLRKLLKHNGVVHLQIKENLYLDFEILKKLLFIGLPGSIQMLLRSFSMVILTKIASLFGPVVVAAYGVGGRLYHLFLFPGFGFGAAASTMVGQNLGAKNPKRAKESTLKSVYYYLIFNLVAGILVFIFAKQLAFVFNTEEEFVRTVSVYFRYITIASVFTTFGVVFSQSLQGAGETVIPMFSTFLSLYIIQIPVAYILSNYLGFKEVGIWIAHVVGNFVNAFVVSLIFFYGNWSERKL